MAYRIEYARSGRSACKGPIPCKGTKIEKGGLRLGSVIEIRGERSLVWRHWGCVTEKIVSNLRENVGDPEDLDGIEELNQEDKQRIFDAFSNGQIDENDVSPALMEAGKGPGGTPSSSPQKKSVPKKKVKKEESEEEEEEWKADESEEEVKPKKKNRANEKVKKEDFEPLPSTSAPKRGRGKAVKEEQNVNHGEEAPKKRGRSSKPQNKSVDTVIAKEEEETVELNEKAKKKRGRPSLSNGAESRTNGARGSDKKALSPTNSTEKNKRGRKAAVKAEDGASTSFQEAIAEQQAGRKRGRPAKANGH